MVGFGLATGIVVTRAGDKVPVVTVAADVPKGHVIERGDLTSQAVSGIAGAIAAEHLEQVVGSTAAVDLVAGQVLVDGMVTDAVLPAAGDSLVGFALDASRVPAIGLATGDLVRVVAVPAGQASGDVDTVNLDTPPVLTQDAVVHSIRGASDGGAIELTLVVAEKDAEPSGGVRNGRARRTRRDSHRRRRVMLTAIGSAKGSPGATTVALALAAVWPDQAAILVEADASGGDLAFRCRHDGGAEVATTPSMTSLAAATRGHTDLGSAASSLLRGHTQRLACGVRVVPGLLGPSQAGAIEHLWGNVAGAANAAEEPVIADVGRITGSLAARAFLDQSAVAVVVCQPTLESLVHTRSLVASLAARVGRPDRERLVLPVVVSRPRHAAAAAADVDEVCAEIPGVDACVPVAVRLRQLPSSWSGGRTLSGRLAGSRLLRSATTLWERIESHRGVIAAADRPVEASR